MKYDEAIAGLEALVRQIEDPERDLAGMADDVKKAMELVKFCKEYIRKGEQEMDSLIDGKDE